MNKTNKHIDFYDETLRDGSQSLWGLQLKHGVIDAVLDKIDQAGFRATTLPIHPLVFQIMVRWGEDPWEMLRLLKRKVKKTKISTMSWVGQVNIDKLDPPAIWKLFARKSIEVTGQSCTTCLANCTDEIRRYPDWFPVVRELGQEVYPTIIYYHSPRTGDEYFVNLTKRVLKFKPERIFLEDVGGLLTTEVVQTLIPAMMKEAHPQGTKIALHTHGAGANSGRVMVEAMKLGIDEIHTCIPPLANGPSLPSIYNAIHNARLLGLTHDINVEPLKVVEERLAKIAKQENLPVGAPLEYDHGVYLHQVPGGVRGTLRNHLGQIGIAHRYDEVLEEVVQVREDLGSPMMATPFSQYVVSQAAVNVALGERYKEILDSVIETALGVWGVEDSGAPYIEPNLKDKILSHPNAKKISERWERDKEEVAADRPIEYYKAQYGMSNASDEDFLLYYVMRGDEEIKKMRAAGPPQSFYTGKEPLPLLLNALSKEKDISRLQLRKGNSFFEFRQNKSVSG
jgi:oxaloacetate decarboxylase alpha subunit